MATILIENFIRQLSEIQEGAPWFDQSFKNKLEKIPATDAFKRPASSVHSVAEQVSHMLEWRKECVLRYNGGKTELMDSPDDWKDNTALEKIGWTELKAALDESTSDLVRLIQDQDDHYLENKIPGH